MELKDAITQGLNLYAYEESEQSFEETNDFDDLWQSIYDVCQIATFGIIELDKEDIDEALSWLKQTQELTKKYLKTEIYF